MVAQHSQTTISLTFPNFPDYSLTNVQFPDFSRFSRWIFIHNFTHDIKYASKMISMEQL